MSPSQIGCTEIPIRTKSIAARSKSERGLSAERIPIGIEISIQKTAPPKSSEAVIGAARLSVVFTSSRLVVERPRLWTVTIRHRNVPYSR